MGIFSKLFGKSNEEQQDEDDDNIQRDYSFLGTDLHSHFIPGIDDGAQTIEDSIALIKSMQGLGYKNIVTTPHVNFDHYPNSSVNILAGLETLRSALKEENIDIPVNAAAEYYIDDHFFQIMDREPLLTIRKKEVLVEISMASPPANMRDIMFNIQLKGYQPILAHPERYLYFMQQRDIFQDLKDRGTQLQLNILSLAGYYGAPQRELAEYLLEKKLYDYAGTDMHHPKHAEVLQRFTQGKSFLKLYKYPFKNSSIAG